MSFTIRESFSVLCCVVVFVCFVVVVVVDLVGYFNCEHLVCLHSVNHCCILVMQSNMLSSGFIYLFVFYILATFKVISEWASAFDSRRLNASEASDAVI